MLDDRLDKPLDDTLKAPAVSSSAHAGAGEHRPTPAATPSEAQAARPPAQGMLARRGWTQRGVFETALIVAGVLGNVLLLPHTLTGDGLDRYYALSQLLSGRGFSAIKYSMIGPIFAAPLWLLSKLLKGNGYWVEYYNTIVFALGLLALWLLLRRWMEARLLRAFLLLLTLVSMFPYHLTQFYGEVFTAITVAVGFTLLALGWGRRDNQRGGGSFIASAALLAVGVANTPATALGLGLALLQRLWRQRRLRVFLSLILAGALILGESVLRRGSALNDGYLQDNGGHTLMPFAGIPGFSYPLLFGLLAILLSFGKGLIFFTPGLFLPVRRRIAELWGERSPIWALYCLWLCFVAGLVLIYAKWWAWYGGWFWGPRFFLFACVPASFALALWTQRPSARLWVNLVALIVLALSVWVGVNGAVFQQASLSVCTNNDYLLETYCHFTPDYSALWRPLVNLYLLGPGLRFAHAEALSRRAVLFGCYIFFVGVYLALPLLAAIWAQSRATLAEWRPRLNDFLAGLRV